MTSMIIFIFFSFRKMNQIWILKLNKQKFGWITVLKYNEIYKNNKKDNYYFLFIIASTTSWKWMSTFKTRITTNSFEHEYLRKKFVTKTATTTTNTTNHPRYYIAILNSSFYISWFFLSLWHWISNKNHRLCFSAGIYDQNSRRFVHS